MGDQNGGYRPWAAKTITDIPYDCRERLLYFQHFAADQPRHAREIPVLETRDPQDVAE
jgi:hypothetical protein